MSEINFEDIKADLGDIEEDLNSCLKLVYPPYENGVDLEKLREKAGSIRAGANDICEALDKGIS